jgi:hypothetical protein
MKEKKLLGLRIPRIQVGTSPFIGAGQFGPIGLTWRRKFLDNAEAMAEVFTTAFKAGIKGVHVIPYGSIADAIKLARDIHPELKVTGSLLPEGADRGLQTLIKLDAQIIFIHGITTDSRDTQNLKLWLDKIRSSSSIAGVATHEPIQTLKILDREAVDCPAFLLPFNKIGYAMQDQSILEDMVNNSEKFFMGMKTLAAGKLHPEDAFEYIALHNISAITVGLTSTTEAEETAKIAKDILYQE